MTIEVNIGYCNASHSSTNICLKILKYILLLQSFTIPFVSIALAELGDKSQLLIFLLATRTKKHLSFLLGVMLGFLLVDGFAILIGSIVVDLVPEIFIKIICGTIFVLLGLLMLFKKSRDEKEEIPDLKNPFLSGFGLIFLAEWGDKTQIASVLFGTQYSPLIVLTSVMCALLLLSGSAIYLGKIFAPKINKEYAKKISGLIFVVLGIAYLIG